MKKLLLMLVACFVAVNVSAQDDEGWSKSFAPVADKADLDGLHTAVAADGSVFVSTTYNQAFQFAGKAVTDPDGLLSSCIVKYDKDGNELWSVSLVGKCFVHAMAADADGTLYVAGQSQDEKVVCTGTDSKHYEIVNPTSEIYGFAFSAFILRIDPNGAIAATTTISSEANAELLTSMMYFPLQGDIYVRPLALRIAGDKLYVSANYTGDILALGWYGSILNVFDFMYADNKSSGIFSMDKLTLGALQNEVNVQNTESMSYNQYYPEAIDFVVYNNRVHMAFIGFGNLSVRNNTAKKDFEFATTSDESGNKEHALVLVPTAELDKSVKFSAAMHAKDGIPYKLAGSALAGDNCILGGTFYGNFPLDNTVTKEHNASFVASIKMSDCSVNWAKANEVESVAKCMIVTGEEIHASTADALYTFRTSDGDLKQTQNTGYADAAQCNDQYVSTVRADENNVVVFCPKLKTSGINETEALNSAAARYYNLNGVELSAPQKGLNIVKTTNGQTQKRVVR